MTGADWEFPPAALFQTVAICPWRERPVRVDGSLGEWGEGELMPLLGELAGGAQFAQLYLAWNERGLYLAVDVPKHERVVTNRHNPASGDALELFIDTRGGRTSHRATQFCYHLIVLPTAPGRGAHGPTIWQRPLRRALQRSPAADLDAIRLAANLREDGYAIELAFPPESLHGYEPAAGVRIGMAAVIHDIQRGTHLWGTSREVPYDRDPSTWGLVEHGRPP
ncbi:MAG: sugar-binding protein [Armatimonadota bacterium]